MVTTGINVRDIAFVRFGCPDLAVMKSFLEDFGLRQSDGAAATDDVLYMRGIGSSPFLHVTHAADEASFLGVAFLADSVADLELLARTEAFSDVEELEGPGGGKVVRTVDPDGVNVEVVAAREPVARIGAPAVADSNRIDRTSRTGAPLRLVEGPAHVARLGHCVLDVVHYPTTSAWYAEHLGLVVSDEVMLDETKPLGAFMRCNRGADYVDHHTMFFVGAGTARFNHAAFEVANLDDLMLGHSHLASRDHTHHWGVGRHILGSQVYDYWTDPFGHVLEHWTDGDLFNNTSPPNQATLQDLLGSQWGPTHTAP